MTPPTVWDAIVVGGGPAGSTAASLLAEAGHSVLIIDRCNFPRPKACGESINPGAVNELRELGLLDDVLGLPHGRVDHWRIHPRRGAPFVGRLPVDATGVAVDRQAFDQLLLAGATERGAQLREGVAVTGLVLDGGRVRGVTTRDGGQVLATVVVGADGLRSVVARRAGLVARAPKLRKIALTAHVLGAGLESGRGELYLRSWGCAGIVSIDGETANVVLVVNGPRRPTGDVARWFDELSAGVPPLAGARRIGKVQATGPFDYPMKEVFRDGLLLVGDAAGYFDPFTGQGIYRALKGGRLAASATSAYLASGDTRELASYSRQNRLAFDHGVRLQKVVEATASRPVLFEAAAGAFRSLPSLADLVVSLAGDVPHHPR